MKNIQEFIEATHKEDNYNVRPAIVCKDGFIISIQGSEFHYCSPRANCRHYDRLELGFPSIAEELILEFAEEPSQPTGTVYGYVPVNIIDEMLEKHGGIDITKTLRLKKEKATAKK